jgi:hypothetical protein
VPNDDHASGSGQQWQYSVSLLRSASRLARQAYDSSREFSTGSLFAGWLNDRQNQIVMRAEDLAREGRFDKTAVDELVALAAGRRRDLERAAGSLSHDNSYREFRELNGAYRLIGAALDGSEVASLSDEEAARIDEIEAFHALSASDAFSELLRREPRLAELEADVRAGMIDGTPDALDAARPIADRIDAALRPLSKRIELSERLSRIIGPRSGQSDPVLSSSTARTSASLHFEQIAGPVVPQRPPDDT